MDNTPKNNRSLRHMWHAMSVSDTLKVLKVRPLIGLTDEEAAERKQQAGIKPLWVVQKRSPFLIFLDECKDISILLLLLTLALVSVFTETVNASLIAVCLVVSLIIRFSIRFLTEWFYAEAAEYDIPTAIVLRGGRYRRIQANEIVPGDILRLQPGETAVCDARLLYGKLQITETLGSSGERQITKNAEDVFPENCNWMQRNNIVFASSLVNEGSAPAIAVYTGENTLAYAQNGIREIPMRKSKGTADRITSWANGFSIGTLVAVLILLVVAVFTGSVGRIDSFFLSMITIVTSGIGSLFRSASTFILAMTARELSVSSVGSSVLKAPDRFCDLAKVQTIVISGEDLLESGNCRIDTWYNGEIHDRVSADSSDLRELISDSYLCSVPSVTENTLQAERREVFYLQTLELLRRYELEPEHEDAKGVYRAYYGDCCVASRQTEDGYEWYACGSLSALLRFCTNVRKRGAVVPLTYDERRQFIEEEERNRDNCFRTIGVARIRSSVPLNAKNLVQLNKMTFIGFYTVATPIEPGLLQMVKKARSGGIRLIILSASPKYARARAAEAGIFQEEDIFFSSPNADFSPLFASKHVLNGVVFCRNAEERAKTVHEIYSHCPDTMILTPEVVDLYAMDKNALTIAADPGGRLNSQLLCRNAEGLAGTKYAHHKKQLTASTAAQSFRMIAYAKNAVRHIRCAADYLMFSQMFRIIIVLIAVVMNDRYLSPERILFLGTIFDAAIVYSFANISPAPGTLASPQSVSRFLRFSDLVFPSIVGILIAVGSFILPAFLKSPFPITLADPVSFAFCSGILCCFLYSCECLHETSLFKGGIYISAATLIPILLLICVFIRMGMTIGLFGVLLSLVPAVFLILLCEFFKFLRKTSEPSVKEFA